VIYLIENGVLQYLPLKTSGKQHKTFITKKLMLLIKSEGTKCRSAAVLI